MSRIGCQYDKSPTVKGNGYHTRVILTVTVSTPMDGWQLSLRLPITRTIRVRFVKGGQLIGGETIENGSSIVVVNRLRHLEAREQFKVFFTVMTGQKGARLFPAAFKLARPPPRMVNGMCTGPPVDVRSTRTKPISENLEYRLFVDFHIKFNRVSSCVLSFEVPVRVTAIHHAEYIGHLDNNTKYFIGIITGKYKEVVIQYEKESSDIAGEGFGAITCQLCMRQSNHTFTVSTPLPITLIDDEDTGENGSGNWTTNYPTSTPSFSSSPSQTVTITATSRGFPTPSLPDKEGTDSGQHSNNADAVNNVGPPAIPTHLPTSVSPKDDSSSSSSSSSSAVPIAVAVGCSIGLLVLSVVVIAMFFSRRKSRSDASTHYGLEMGGQVQSHNVYARAANGHASSAFMGPPAGGQASEEFMKDGGRYRPEYEELEVYLPKESENLKGRENVEYHDGVPSGYASLLPNPMMDVKQAQSNHYDAPLTDTKVLGHYSIPRPSERDSIIESGDEGIPEHLYMSMRGNVDTYVKMNNPSLQKALKSQDQDEKNEPDSQNIGKQEDQKDSDMEDEHEDE